MEGSIAPSLMFMTKTDTSLSILCLWSLIVKHPKMAAPLDSSVDDVLAVILYKMVVGVPGYFTELARGFISHSGQGIEYKLQTKDPIGNKSWVQTLTVLFT